jgi:hypothetical protein
VRCFSTRPTLASSAEFKNVGAVTLLPIRLHGLMLNELCPKITSPLPIIIIIIIGFTALLLGLGQFSVFILNLPNTPGRTRPWGLLSL